MERTTVVVPAGVRYILDWKEFKFPDYPCIINKRMTGCGITEYCLRPNPNLPNVILVSPRRALLESKEEHHNNPKGSTPEEIEYLKKTRGPIWYARNTSELVREVDADMTKTLDKEPKERVVKESVAKEAIMNLREGVIKYWTFCKETGSECKIMVTYDSFRHVKEILGPDIMAFQIVVDEFQSIFTDATFKSDTELELVYQLQGLQRVCYVSATPMLDRYLEQMQEFKDLPYYDLDWKTADPGRVRTPRVEVVKCNRPLEAIQRWIDKYKNGKFDRKSWLDPKTGLIKEVYSKELVIYVNSVKNICSIIRGSKLSPAECNVLCANTPDNLRKIRSAFRSVDKSYNLPALGDIPDYEEPRKMFTFCTRTVYLGADFYSDNAQSIIISDANIDCLAVDISLDLPQIMGRQRLEENPWKNEATMYYRTTFKNMPKEEFEKFLHKKESETQDLLKSFEVTPSSTLAGRYLCLTKVLRYKFDYLSVNKHAGSTLQPVFNKLVRLSDIRAYEVQQEDFKDQFSVFSVINSSDFLSASVDPKLFDFLSIFDEETTFRGKMKMACEFIEVNPGLEQSILGSIPYLMESYIQILGAAGCKKAQYKKSLIEKLYQDKLNAQKNNPWILDEIYREFQEGQSYAKSTIKDKLQGFYDKYDISKTAKATDLEEYFEVTRTMIGSGDKRVHAFKIIKKKQ